jgi:NADPH2:quinone reductase
MHAYYLGAANGAPALELRDVPKPEAKAGQMIIKIKASSLNRGEFIVGAGLHHGKGDTGAKPCGLDAAGEVTEVGPGVDWKVGARVMGRTMHGFAEYGIVDVRDAMPVPDHMSWQDAASIPIVFLTAYDMLVANGGLKANEWLLIAGASAGVGVACILTAKALGARVIGTSGSADKIAALKRLGMDHGINARGKLPQDEIKRITGGHGVDVVVNNVGGSMFDTCIEAMAYRGRLAVVGYVDGTTRASVDFGTVHANRLHIFGVSNKNRSADERAESVAGFKRDILPLIAAGKIKPAIDKVFPFDQLPAAQARMQANEQIGKIVITH